MKVIEAKDFGPVGFRWLTLKRITWEDTHGRTRFWEVAERTTRAGEVDGVAIIAKVVRAGQEPHVVTISQFRPPVANYCLELPAGLVERGESAAEAAVRELREETGFVGHVAQVWPPCGGDPGMSSSNMQIVVVEVDGDAPQNQSVEQQLDDGEFITVTLVPMRDLMQHLLDVQSEKGWEIDSRLMAYAAGLQHASFLLHTDLAGAAAAADGKHGIAGSQPAKGPSQAAASNGAAADLAGFGSLVPDDSELGHAVEAALAAVGQNGSCTSAGGPCAQEPGARAAAGRAAASPKQAAAANGECQQAEAPSTAAAKSRTHLWLAAKLYICTPQFGLGLGTGLAVALLLGKMR